MKTISYILLAVLFFTACEKKNPSYTENEKVLEALEQAYADNSTTAYQEILASWNQEIPSKSEKDLSSQAEENVYAIFQKLYSPFDIDHLGWHEWGNMYEGYEYAVVQNQVFFDNSYDEYKAETRDSIMDFRPELNLGDKTVLYLTDNYSGALNEFLDAADGWAFREGPQNISAEEAAARLSFLREYLAIVHGHWGYYFHLETHPDVSLISFNDDEDMAVAYFRVGYMFGEAWFSKNLVWKMDSSAISGIEK